MLLLPVIKFLIHHSGNIRSLRCYWFLCVVIGFFAPFVFAHVISTRGDESLSCLFFFLLLLSSLFFMCIAVLADGDASRGQQGNLQQRAASLPN